MTAQPDDPSEPRSRADGAGLARVPWPPTLLVAGIVVGWSLDHVLPLTSGAAWPKSLVWAGFGLFVAALVVDAWAILTMVRARTNVLPTRGADQLLQSGPFAWSRHPIYFANTALLAGIGLAVGNVWILLASPLYALLVRQLAMLPEERHLSAKFGAEWEAYRARVGRWIGRI